jgi:hypothetical protein
MQELEHVNLCREDEIALGQAIDLMGPNCYFSATPTKANIRVMPLLFREIGYAINKRLRLFEVLEFVFLPQVVLLHNFPTLELGLEFCNLFTFQ